MTPFDAWILGMVEGITEYLPVSSTGHLVLTSWLLGLDRTPEQRQAVHDFEIIIQGGAILAVLGLYRARIGQMVRGTATRFGVGGLGPKDRMEAGWTIARTASSSAARPRRADPTRSRRSPCRRAPLSPQRVAAQRDRRGVRR